MVPGTPTVHSTYKKGPDRRAQGKEMVNRSELIFEKKKKKEEEEELIYE